MSPRGYLTIAAVSVCILVTNGQDEGASVYRGPKQSPRNDEESDGNNTVVILGVTLALSVIFAVAGVFIGLYFNVERYLCCCCRTSHRDVTKQASNPPAPAGGHVNPNMFMTQDRGYSATSDDPWDVTIESTQKISLTSAQRTRRKPSYHLLAKQQRPRGDEHSSLVFQEVPAAFGARVTTLGADGTMVKTPVDDVTMNETRRFALRDESKGRSDGGYGAAATTQDDILY